MFYAAMFACFLLFVLWFDGRERDCWLVFGAWVLLSLLTGGRRPW